MKITDSKNYLDNYLSSAERLFVKEEQVIYHENSCSSGGIYYLKKGLIRISTHLHTGEDGIIDIVSDENSFGEQAMDGNLYFSTASAIKSSVIYYFSRENIDKLMETDYEFRTYIYKNLTNKLNTLLNKLLFHSLQADKVLARTILVLSNKFESNQIFVSQQELCRYSNLNRVTIYNTFKKWDDNIVSFKNKKVTIENKRLLERIAAI